MLGRRASFVVWLAVTPLHVAGRILSSWRIQAEDVGEPQRVPGLALRIGTVVTVVARTAPSPRRGAGPHFVRSVADRPSPRKGIDRMTDAEKLTRRSTIAGAGGLVIALPLLAACGASSTDTAPAQAAAKRPASRKPPATPTSRAGASTTSPLTTTKEVPVGGGIILAQKGIVVTQPRAGTIKGFSAICTHQGCPVSQIVGGNIECPCHGSLFSINDGSVVRGPATAPLQPVNVTVTKNGNVTTDA